jgi:hypothetical protein
MTDKPMPWPYKAKEARDRSAEEAARIVRAIESILEGQSPDGRGAGEAVGACIARGGYDPAFA